jgi:hypothetical protein
MVYWILAIFGVILWRFLLATKTGRGHEYLFLISMAMEEVLGQGSQTV